MRHVAVIDIGKTNAKLALVDLVTLTEVEVLKTPNRVRPGPPWPHFDLDTLWEFILDGLSRFAARRVDAVAVTTHGASLVLLDGDGGLAAPMLDYEHDGPDALGPEYDAIRPDFAETGSPRLPMGLNAGAQLHYMFATNPRQKARTAQVLTYPQYWAYRLSGVTSNEVTSLGTHTDLWNPAERRFSGLVDRLSIADRMAPLRKADDRLGPILPEVAARTGLRPDTPVLCGIHDSNASLLPHLKRRSPPFSVVSTGTWVIAMCVGGRPVTLDPERDTLTNVNVFGDPVPSARFMGGREYELLGGDGDASEADLAQALRGEPMLLPSVVAGTGPFPGMEARWLGPEPSGGLRRAAVALYLAMMTASCLELAGHRGEVVVEGPMAGLRGFSDMLSSATGSVVVLPAASTGTSIGCAMLAATDTDALPPVEERRVDARDDPATNVYAETWRRRVRDGTGR